MYPKWHQYVMNDPCVQPYLLFIFVLIFICSFISWYLKNQNLLVHFLSAFQYFVCFVRVRIEHSSSRQNMTIVSNTVAVEVACSKVSLTVLHVDFCVHFICVALSSGCYTIVWYVFLTLFSPWLAVMLNLVHCLCKIRHDRWFHS